MLPDSGRCLPDNYGEIFDELLEHLAKCSSGKKKKLTAFWPMIGERYVPGEGLMVIGRAVNGWEPIESNWWEPGEAGATGKRQEIIERVRSLAIEDTSWVTRERTSSNDYNPNKSAFWRVIRQTVANTYPMNELEQREWSGAICWSNLCKLSPAEKGNPPGWLRDVQLKHCIELLRIELQSLKPARVLVLAGKDWYETFMSKLGVQGIREVGQLVEYVGCYDAQRWVFAKHPQCKPEKLFVDQVLAGFRD